MSNFKSMMAQDSPLHMFAEFDGDINKIFEQGKEGDMPILTTVRSSEPKPIRFSGLFQITVGR